MITFLRGITMLGKNTKCDLSAGLAKLDIDILTKQVEIHFYSLVGDIRRKASEIHPNTLNIEDRKRNVSSMSSSGADDFIRLSKNLAETTELLHTLYETTDREVEVV